MLARHRQKVYTPRGDHQRVLSRGLQATFTLTFERESAAKPVCVAELLLRYGA